MTRKKLVLVGAGGFGREVLYQLLDINEQTEQYNVLGFVDDVLYRPGDSPQMVDGCPVVGNDEWLLRQEEPICVVICLGNPLFRRKLAEKYLANPHLEFPTIIAGNAQYSNSVTFGKGCIVCLSNTLTVDIAIGDFTILNMDCTIGHDVVIEDFVTLSPGVHVSGKVTIGQGTEVGTGSCIIQGITIGRDSTVGAGSVVVRDIPGNCTAVGVPAKPIKFH